VKDAPHSDPHFDAVLEVIRSRSGLAPTPSRRRDFEAGVAKAMTRAGIADAEAFARHLESDERIFDRLVEDLTVAETYFFREPTQFDVMRQEILPDLKHSRPDAKLRIWSAGCASGEEPYSLAILAEQENLAERATILGTDVARSALKHARAGAYGTWSLRGCSADFISRYFHRRGDRFVLLERIRQKVEFGYFNLASDVYRSDLDLIVCRNVLIYFDRDIVERVARQLYGALREGGWLIAGPSDPPLWDAAPYETVVTSAGVFYRRGRAASLRSIARPTSAPLRAVPPPPHPAPVMSAAPLAPTRVEIVPASLDPLAEAEGAFRTGNLPRVLELTRMTLSDPRASALRARALANLGDSQAAATFGAEATLLHPLCPELHYLQAVILMSLGRHLEAIPILRRVIYLDRSLAVAHFTLGSLLSRCGAPDQARLAYRNVLALCAERPQEEIVPLSEGERTSRLMQAARVQLTRIGRNAKAEP
jgi:chemotaxis protein methyltransferase CheR